MHIFSQSPLGFSVAASVRVGNALGAGNPKQAVLSCKVSIICACKKQVILKRNNWKQTAGYMCYQHVCKQSLKTQVMSSPSLFEISTCELFSHAVHFYFVCAPQWQLPVWLGLSSSLPRTSLATFSPPSSECTHRHTLSFTLLQTRGCLAESVMLHKSIQTIIHYLWSSSSCWCTTVICDCLMFSR